MIFKHLISLFLLFVISFVTFSTLHARSAGATPKSAKMIVDGTNLYIATEKNKVSGIYLYDISEPGKPVLKKTVNLPEKFYIQDFFINTPSDDTSVAKVVVSDGDSYRFFNAANLEETNSILLEKNEKSLNAATDSLTIRKDDGTIIKIDISPRKYTVSYTRGDEKEKSKTVTCTIPYGTPYKIRMADNNLYIANGFHGMGYIGQLGNEPPYELKSEITLTNTIGKYSAYGTFVYDLAIKNNTAYLAAGESGIIIVDVSNKKNLKITGNIPELMWSAINGIILHPNGKYLYAADENSGLITISLDEKTIIK